MGKKLDPKEKKLYQRVDEILYYDWDPIGVSDQPSARDEYYSYLPAIFSLLKESEDGKEIEDVLVRIQKDHMGFSKVSKVKVKEVVGKLLAAKALIFEKPT